MTQHRLTDKQQRVLFGLLRHPGLSDNDLSSCIDVNMSTIATIKNSLRKRGYFHTVRIPLLHNINCELMVVSYGRFGLSYPLEKLVEAATQTFHPIPNYFFTVASTSGWVSIAIARDHTEAKEIIESLERLRYKNKLGEGTVHHVYFPTRLTTFANVFDYAPAVYDHFDLELDWTKRRFPKCKVAELSDSEREVFYGLVKYPDLPDNQISKHLTVSPSTVNNMRKRFEKRDLMIKSRFLDLTKIDHELLIFHHMQFKPTAPVRVRTKLLQQMGLNSSMIFHLADNLEEVAITVHENYDTYRRERNNLVRFYREQDLLKRQPYTIMFSLPETKFLKALEYSAVTKKELELPKELIEQVADVLTSWFGDHGILLLKQQLDRMGVEWEKLGWDDMPDLIDGICASIVPYYNENVAESIREKLIAITPQQALSNL